MMGSMSRANVSALNAARVKDSRQLITVTHDSSFPCFFTYATRAARITSDNDSLYDFGRDNGFLLFDDRMGERRKVDVDFKHPEDQKSAINLTMGF